MRCYTTSPEKVIKRILFAVLAVAAFWWATESFLQVGLQGPTFLFGGFGVLLTFYAATGAG